MPTFQYVFLVITVIISIMIIGLVLLQKGGSGGASGALMGKDLNLFANTKERGSEKIVSMLTLSLVMMFITLAVALRL